MQTVSTWSQDVARGLDHPDSVEARRARLATAKLALVVRNADFQSCLRQITKLARSPEDAVQVLHALTAGLNSPTFKSTEIGEIVEQIDVLADEIEFRGEA